jgi:hypothetical protein
MQMAEKFLKAPASKSLVRFNENHFTRRFTRSVARRAGRLGGTAEPLRISSVLPTVLALARAQVGFVLGDRTQGPLSLVLQCISVDIRKEHCSTEAVEQ